MKLHSIAPRPALSVPVLFYCGLIATAAFAQAPANLLDAGAFEREAAAFLVSDRGETIPDTTEPWRYYPLEVGNTWEYLQTNETYKRLYIEKDTLINELQYFIVNGQNFDENAEPTPLIIRESIRYDSLEAQVVVFRAGTDRSYFFDCPLHAPFGSTCDHDVVVGGEYGTLLVFHYSYSEPDSIHTSVKIMEDWFEEYRFAADFGKVYFFCSECGFGWALRATRLGGWDGEVYGEFVIPPPQVSSDPLPQTHRSSSIRAWPNPFQDNVNVAFDLSQPGPVVIDVVDLLGRIVGSHDLGILAAGPHETTIATPALLPGSYVLRTRSKQKVLISSILTRIR